MYYAKFVTYTVYSYFFKNGLPEFVCRKKNSFCTMNILGDEILSFFVQFTSQGLIKKAVVSFCGDIPIKFLIAWLYA